MNIIKIDRNNLVNGDGMRCVIWCSGCFWACHKCQNPETHNPSAGHPFCNDDVEIIKEQLSRKEVSGVTLSGGDPFHPNNRDGMTKLCKYIKKEFPNKSIWCYTGYTFEDIKNEKLMSYIDVLVDGNYIDELNPKDRALLWRGSSNQRIIDVPKSIIEGRTTLYIRSDFSENK